MQNSCAISQADELAAFLQGSVRQNFLYQGCDVKIPDEILLGSATCLEIATQLLPALRLAIALSAKQRDWIRSSLARVQATPSRMVTLTSMAVRLMTCSRPWSKMRGVRWRLIRRWRNLPQPLPAAT